MRPAHLHVAAAALHAHLADDVHRGVTQPLVLLVGQGLDGGHGDGVACRGEEAGGRRRRGGRVRCEPLRPLGSLLPGCGGDGSHPHERRAPQGAAQRRPRHLANDRHAGSAHTRRCVCVGRRFLFLTGVHAHGVDVLDGADDDHVVSQVTHHLQQPTRWLQGAGRCSVAARRGSRVPCCRPRGAVPWMHSAPDRATRRGRDPQLHARNGRLPQQLACGAGGSPPAQTPSTPAGSAPPGPGWSWTRSGRRCRSRCKRGRDEAGGGGATGEVRHVQDWRWSQASGAVLARCRPPEPARRRILPLSALHSPPGRTNLSLIADHNLRPPPAATICGLALQQPQPAPYIRAPTGTRPCCRRCRRRCLPG